MSLFKKTEFKVIIGLFLFLFLFYKVVNINKDDEIRRKELRMKYYL
jgi:hypothetical protein